MSERDRLPTGPALDQLREVIAILRELANAGPRDQSFKQWRQVTVTLLQRIWPGDPSRASHFRRIGFSAPSLRADAATTREHFERGCTEATVYLEGLALELEAAMRPPGVALVRPPEVPVRTAADGPRGPERPLEPSLPPADAAPSATPDPPRATDAPRPVPPAEAADERRRTAPPPASRPSAKPEAARAPARPRQRLKDMLGFGDESALPAPARPAPREPAATPAAGTAQKPAASVPPPPPAVAPQPPVGSTPPPAEPTPPAAAPPSPQAWLAPITPLPTRGTTPAPRAGSDPPPDEVLDLDFDLEDVEFEPGLGPGFDPADEDEIADDPPPPATLREMLDREIAAAPRMPSRAAREVLTMAAMVDQLGVPPQRRAIVRAALIDLGRQMESPPVHWVAIRQAMAFMMDYPQIARRILPMLMPYLDEAA